MFKKILMILIGVLFVGVGVFIIINGKNMVKRCTEGTVGTVIDVIEEREENNDSTTGGGYTYTYFPVIEYKAESKTLSKKYSTGSGRQKYQIGDKVDIMYDPNKPEDYLIKNDKSSDLLGAIFIVLGTVATIVAL